MLADEIMQMEVNRKVFSVDGKIQKEIYGENNNCLIQIGLNLLAILCKFLVGDIILKSEWVSTSYFDADHVKFKKLKKPGAGRKKSTFYESPT